MTVSQIQKWNNLKSDSIATGQSWSSLPVRLKQALAQ
nr:LysM peptidoglycan-binding domain-containing protein [Secundilactobacillus paracollinoides]